jgi:hypothetical protein
VTWNLHQRDPSFGFCHAGRSVHLGSYGNARRTQIWQIPICGLAFRPRRRIPGPGRGQGQSLLKSSGQALERALAAIAWAGLGPFLRESSRFEACAADFAIRRSKTRLAAVRQPDLRGVHRRHLEVPYSSGCLWSPGKHGSVEAPPLRSLGVGSEVSKVAQSSKPLSTRAKTRFASRAAGRESPPNADFFHRHFEPTMIFCLFSREPLLLLAV